MLPSISVKLILLYWSDRPACVPRPAPLQLVMFACPSSARLVGKSALPSSTGRRDVLSWWLVSALKLSLSCPVLTTFSSLSDTYLNNCLWTCNGYNCNKRDVILEKRVDLPELALVKNEELSYGTISTRTCLGTCSIQREACIMSGKLYTQMYLMQIIFAWSVHRLPSILSRC
jgi:hypothetical protein